MELKPERLAQHLADTLAPAYLVYGDEPLLVEEAADAIRTAARARGFGERQRLEVAHGFDWQRLEDALSHLSLFSDRRLVELRLPKGRPGDEGARALAGCAGRLPPDCLLLVVCGRLESAQRRSRWVRALTEAGVAVPVWPVTPARLPAWVGERLRAAGLQAEPAVAALIAERAEGNLLAAVQEIEKLRLLFPEGRLDITAARAAVTDSARFDPFELVDSALAGDAARTLRILHGLRAEGVEPVLVNWALARELRLLTGLARVRARGGDLADAMRRARLFRERQARVRRALDRLPDRAWGRLLGRCARIDRIVKGVESGQPWNELLQLALAVAGHPWPRARRRRA